MPDINKKRKPTGANYGGISMLKISPLNEKSIKTNGNENLLTAKDADFKNASGRDDNFDRIAADIRASLDAFIC